MVHATTLNQLSSTIASHKPTNFATQMETESFQCKNPQYDCSNHGFCSQDGLSCICDSKYDTFECHNSQCCYRKEPRVKLFLTSFFVTWIGVPFFILGNVGLGIGMIVLCCGGCCLSGVGTAMGAKKGDGAGMCVGLIGALATLACSAYCLYTWIVFAAETEPWNDKNGVPVAPW